MVKVITYGTFDLLHYGHIKLLERAKKLGDYLIVGITTDDYDKSRGKINVRQTLTERIEAVKNTGLADKIIIEEYEGQKIDDIKRYGVDIFTVGSDWIGKFDYLKEYCNVVYLDRTKGVSSSKLRNEKKLVTLGIVGNYAPFLNKFQKEDKYVNGIEIVGICTNNINSMSEEIRKLEINTSNYNELLDKVDAVYLRSNPEERYNQIKLALNKHKHVLCESPITLDKNECKELFEIAKANKCILMEAIKTAYSVAYSRLLLLIKAGKIGEILSIDVTCTSIKDNAYKKESFMDWGPTALLPIFQIMGTDYLSKNIITRRIKNNKEDIFTKVNLIYEHSTASLKVAEGAKAEGSLVITGTEGYIYVPAPWWKTDYFEIRYENQTNNKRYFYQLDGEGIRYELVSFVRNIQEDKNFTYIDRNISIAISNIMQDFINNKDVTEI